MSKLDAHSEPPPTAAGLRAIFDSEREETIGLEEEVMVLDPETLDLTPRAHEVIAAAEGDGRFKRELPRAQLELISGPARSVADGAAAMREARAAAIEAAAGNVCFAAAGAHPFAAAEGELQTDAHYEFTRDRYAMVARRQLVFGLHVHVAVRGSDRALAAYNALRGQLPELAALASDAPFHEGADTGLASVRPHISGMLPRQGIPPALASWDQYAESLAWMVRSGVAPVAGSWWWEMRLHPVLGTLELRVPDAQATIAESAAVAAVVQCLVAQALARVDAGAVRDEPVDTWRIAENRWSACRHGVAGEMADLETGEREPTAQRLARLLDQLAPHAAALGCEAELADAGAMLVQPAPRRHREIARADGLNGVARRLVADFAR